VYPVKKGASTGREEEEEGRGENVCNGSGGRPMRLAICLAPGEKEEETARAAEKTCTGKRGLLNLGNSE